MNRHKSQNFTRKVWRWHHAHAPELPWRKTDKPYRIFISEVMLQQTQIARVLEKYPLFLKQFPTVRILASAPITNILSAWQGMGYNRRGLYLKRAAEQIVEQHRARVPKTEHELRALPGIGPYSARAIMCFAYGICKPFIETNIRRAIIHEFCAADVSDNDILVILEKLQPKKNQREWYWALMDYGRDALKHVPNPNRHSKHYVKQSRFEGSPRYVRAKIIAHLLTNKKATVAQLHASLIKDKNLKNLVHSGVQTALAGLEKEQLVQKSGSYFLIA